MPERNILELAQRYVPGIGTPQIVSLQQGIVNSSFRVTRSQCQFALRVSEIDSDELGADHVWEQRVLERVGVAGIAPPVAVCVPDEGILVTHWIFGQEWAAEGCAAASSFGRIASLMRNIHSLPAPSRPLQMHPRLWCDRYRKALQRRRIDDKSFIADAVDRRADQKLAEYSALAPPAPVLCHSDLHPLNIVQTPAGVVVLDWEFAHLGDPFWDLAGWIANNDLSITHGYQLVCAYRQREPAGLEAHRLGLLTWLYDYVCFLWIQLYVLIRRNSSRIELIRRMETLRSRLESA